MAVNENSPEQRNLFLFRPVIPPVIPTVPSNPSNSSAPTFLMNSTNVFKHIVSPSQFGKCAPFPPCNPLGCGPEVAPINCSNCNGTAVGIILCVLCFLAVFIVFANILVITIISRNESLRRRHGHIKISLAFADLLVGLFVIPAAIFNLVTIMYLPSPPNESDQTTTDYVENLANQLAQQNTFASGFFGTITILSLTCSVYNLLLLSLDRFFAVAKPLQLQTGKYFNDRKLKFSLIAIWVMGLILSCLPTLIPSKFAYQLDETTLFYFQVVKAGENFTVIAFTIFYVIVVALPFLVVISLSITTLVLTLRKLQFRKENTLNAANPEQVRRMKMIFDTCPEMKFDATEKGFAVIWNKICHNNSKNKANSLQQNRSDAAISTLQRRRAMSVSAKQMNARVTSMILTMVAVFTISILPLMVVTIMFAYGFLNCSNFAPAYNVVVYIHLTNSCANFFIYNLWHKDFRLKLKLLLKCPLFPKKKKRSTSTTTGNDRIKFSSGAARRSTASGYYQKKLRKKTSSFSNQKHNLNDKNSK